MIDSQNDVVKELLLKIDQELKDLKYEQTFVFQEYRYELQSVEHKLKRLQESISDMEEDLRSVETAYTSFTFIIPIIKWIVTTTAAVIASYVAWRSLR